MAKRKTTLIFDPDMKYYRQLKLVCKKNGYLLESLKTQIFNKAVLEYLNTRLEDWHDSKVPATSVGLEVIEGADNE